MPLPFGARDGSPPTLEPFDFSPGGVADVAGVADLVGVPGPRAPGVAGMAGVAVVAPDFAGLSVVAWPLAFDFVGGGVFAGLAGWVVVSEAAVGACGPGVA